MNAFNRLIPFNDLPLLPPKENLETKTVMRKTITASRALAQLNGAIINLPNPRLFIDTIHLQEAKSSSEIENIITTNDDLYKSVVAEKKLFNPALKEVINYKEALWHGLEILNSRPLITTNLCIEIVQCIRQNTSGIRLLPGTALIDAKGEVIYSPPSGEQVIREKLTNLEKFVNEDDSLDPLLKMALMHYQFEAIHPFFDGNGRTGRILLLLYLKMENLLDIPAIYLSEYIIRNKSEYYKRLRGVTEKDDWENWILFILEMIEYSSKKGLKRLENILALMQVVSEQIKMQLPGVFSKELIEILFRLPYTKRQFLINASLGTSKTVGNYLIALEKHGFLKSTRIGKEKLYLNYRLMELLEKN
jgi:Fic family protein